MAYSPRLRLSKGSELTWSELDNNFQQITNELNTLTVQDNALSTRITINETNIASIQTLANIYPSTGNNGDVITWNNGLWVAAAPTNTLPTGSANGDILKWDATGNIWYSAPETHPLELPTTANVGEVVMWDGSAWVANTIVQAQELPATANTNDYLMWDGSAWVANTLTHPTELPLTATLDDVLTWDGSAWVANAIPSELPIGDSSNNTLQWNGTDWVAVSSVELTGELIANTTPGSNGQVLVSQGAGASPVWQTLSAGPTVVRSGALTAANQISFAHGQATAPDLVWMELVMTASDNGYVAGDIIKLYGWTEEDETDHSLVIWCNGTELGASVRQTGDYYLAASKGGGAQNYINGASGYLQLVGVWF